MTITKPNTQSIVVGVAIFVTFVSAFLSWISIDLPKTSLMMGADTSGNLFDVGGQGTFLFILVLLALALWIAVLFIQAFPPNVQMPLMGAPIFLAILGVLSLLFWVFVAIDGDYGNLGLGISVDRGYGLWIGLVAILVWTVVSAIQAKPLLEMAKAMKDAQKQPPAA